MSSQKRPGRDPVRRTAPPAWKLVEKMHLPNLLREKFDFLLHARNRQFFFETVRKVHHEGGTSFALIEKAYGLIRHEFRGRRRRSGECEREHPIRCALMLMVYVKLPNPDWIVAMLLHDLVETFRNKWTIERIAHEFNPEVAELVRWLTRPVQNGTLRTDRDVDLVYYPLLADAPWAAVLLKAIDRFDNLITYWRSAETTWRKLTETKETILRIMKQRKMPLTEEMELVIEYLSQLTGQPAQT